MVLQSAIIKPQVWGIKTKTEECQVAKKKYGRWKKVTRHKSYPDWSAMENFPKEAIDYFKRYVNEDGTVDSYIVWRESETKTQNEFFIKYGITKENLIKLEDEKCTSDRAIKVTWDADPNRLLESSPNATKERIN